MQMDRNSKKSYNQFFVFASLLYLYTFSFPEALGFHLIELHLEDRGGRELVEDEQVWGDEDEGGEDGQDQDKNHLQRSCYLGLREKSGNFIDRAFKLKPQSLMVYKMSQIELKSGSD